MGVRLVVGRGRGIAFGGAELNVVFTYAGILRDLLVNKNIAIAPVGDLAVGSAESPNNIRVAAAAPFFVVLRLRGDIFVTDTPGR